MKTKDANNIIPINYDARMYIKWLATDAMNASQAARELYTGYYDTTQPTYSDLITQINTYLEQVTIDIVKIKEHMAKLPNPLRASV
ncbi:MAG: hypothetical protein VKL60_05715 [Sphaerospermopsis sp.]|nr:hypothetical protein [Sphaerospermopsis sp.]